MLQRQSVPKAYLFPAPSVPDPSNVDHAVRLAVRTPDGWKVLSQRAIGYYLTLICALIWTQVPLLQIVDLLQDPTSWESARLPDTSTLGHSDGSMRQVDAMARGLRFNTVRSDSIDGTQPHITSFIGEPSQLEDDWQLLAEAEAAFTPEELEIAAKARAENSLRFQAMSGGDVSRYRNAS